MYGEELGIQLLFVPTEYSGMGDAERARGRGRGPRARRDARVSARESARKALRTGLRADTRDVEVAFEPPRGERGSFAVTLAETGKRASPVQARARATTIAIARPAPSPSRRCE